MTAEIPSDSPADPDAVETRYAEANGITIAYETFGNPSDPAVLLVMGLGTQMIAWPDPFCRHIAEQGFYVVRFDNRDVGLSTHFAGEVSPGPLAATIGRKHPAYHLDDMAADAVGLIDALNLGRVHLVGASMGGFISQLIAIGHPEKISSLTLIMTSTGGRWVGRASAKVMAMIVRRRPVSGRDEAIDATVETYRMIGSPAYPVDQTALRKVAGISYDRGFDPAGQRRQFAAIAAQTDRSEGLAGLTMPTVVLHGLSDPLVSPTGGMAIARTIPGARFVGYHGMAHDLPAALWPEFYKEIFAVIAKAGESNSG